ncbi:predicted D-glycerate permease [Robiginitalea myxolifaciens]|uniref:Predicted D-glycerate permease n=1 Tax=Robiginitalea myxolifaciens TaxID=400055 RepID=A0A1I6G4L2_9FLAO|nr:GntP family permease [Robiginitalea myxolifaciens]SFR37081.1 predicted D-glycerate permease [Robiginitalea myxolifaciens]
MEFLYLILAVLAIIGMTAYLKWHPFLALLLVSIIYAIASGMSLSSLIEAINTGFGGTLGKIGLIIVIGVIIGAFLEHSGGARTLARTVLKWIGSRRIPLAMGVLGYVVSIPVFCDSGFMLLDPLGKSLSRNAKVSLAGAAVALGLGLMATHVLVPPTPGPIAAAGILQADLGLVILYALPVSLLAMVAAVLFASRYASRTYLDPGTAIAEDAAQQEKATPEKDPPFAKAVLPIIIPILLIVLKSTLWDKAGEGTVNTLIGFLGEPVIALLIGMFLSFTLPAQWDSKMLSASGWVGKGIRDSSSILLITGAGGIFGQVLEMSGIAASLGSSLQGLELGILLPFLLAAALKTAQGSSTVALVTGASILFPMLADLGLTSETDKALSVVALGAGSAVISHANDSFFWVVTQMSGMDVRTGYRLFSLGTLVLGTTAALGVFICSMIVG